MAGFQGLDPGTWPQWTLSIPGGLANPEVLLGWKTTVSEVSFPGGRPISVPGNSAPQVVPGLVTVVMPAYRADQYIGDALEGVARQRYASWELIVVEDASQGGTREAVEAFARQMPDRRVQYLRHSENRGPSAARNTAITHSRGEFLALLDADDRWLETHLEASIKTLRDQDADIAYSTVVTFRDETDLPTGVWGPTEEELRTFPASLVGRNFIAPSAAVLRRGTTETIGLFDEDPAIQSCEDLDYWLRAVEAGLKFARVPGCHCLYRKGNPDSGSGNLPRIIYRQTLVLARHFGKGGIPARIWRRNLVYYRTAAGVLNLENDPRLAARCFLDAWRARPVRLDLVLLALLCRTVLPFLPDLGIVRRINRAFSSR